MSAKEEAWFQELDAESAGTPGVQRVIGRVDGSALMQASPEHAQRLKEALWRAAAIPRLAESAGELAGAVADITKLRTLERGQRTRGTFRVAAHTVGVRDVTVSGVIECDETIGTTHGG